MSLAWIFSTSMNSLKPWEIRDSQLEFIVENPRNWLIIEIIVLFS